MTAKNGDMRCVKALLAHKCELHVKGRLGGQEKFAWEIAKEQGFVKVAQYLNGCVGQFIIKKAKRNIYAFLVCFSFGLRNCLF